MNTSFGEHQFGVAMLMILFLVLHFFIVPWKGVGMVFNRSRWMLYLGILLFVLLFFLQYATGYRDRGEMVACVLLDIVLFLPAQWLINLSALYVLSNGRISRRLWGLAPACYIVSLAVLLVSVVSPSGWFNFRFVSCLVSVFFGLVLFSYNLVQFRAFLRVRSTIYKYYNKTGWYVIRWCSVSVVAFSLLALSSPLVVLVNVRQVSQLFILLLVGSVCYYVFGLACFGVGEYALRTCVPGMSAEGASLELPVSTSKNANGSVRVEKAVRKWLDQRGHLKPGVTIQNAVDEMHIPRYLLVQWIRNTEFVVFSRWIMYLRIEEAKRMLSEHPEYSNEAVARECGFTSRSYFQKMFKGYTSMTPMEFQARKRESVID